MKWLPTCVHVYLYKYICAWKEDEEDIYEMGTNMCTWISHIYVQLHMKRRRGRCLWNGYQHVYMYIAHICTSIHEKKTRKRYTKCVNKMYMRYPHVCTCIFHIHMKRRRGRYTWNVYIRCTWNIHLRPKMKKSHSGCPRTGRLPSF